MIYWNPNPIAFTIPFLEVPVYIYGLCFVTGFILGYYLLIRLMQTCPIWKDPANPIQQTKSLVDHLTWVIVGATIVGARLGHVFLYDWPRYQAQPWLILNTREGGLASHGGTLAILIALALFYAFVVRKKTTLSFLGLLDLICIPTALGIAFIRFGNFFNQEIIGIPTNLPWGVVFGAYSSQTAVHPVQLYEGISYIATFALLMYLFYFTKVKEKPGLITGIFFFLVFGARFLIEYLKAPLDSVLDQSFFQAGQTLSLPFIAAGMILMIRSLRYKYENRHI